MKPTKIWANLAVSDLQRTANFYNAIGFKPNGKDYINEQLTSFLAGDENFIMHFFLKEVLQPAMKGAITDSHTANEIIFTIACESKVLANEWAQEIVAAGGKLISEPEDFGPGFYGFVFADPDGHKFNVFCM